MRTLSLTLQITGMALMPPALAFGVFFEHGMRMEMTLLTVGTVLFYIGRIVEPKAE